MQRLKRLKRSAGARAHAQCSHGLVCKATSDSRAAGSVCMGNVLTNGPHGPLRLRAVPGDCVEAKASGSPARAATGLQTSAQATGQRNQTKLFILSTWNSETLSLLKSPPFTSQGPRVTAGEVAEPTQGLTREAPAQSRGVALPEPRGHLPGLHSCRQSFLSCTLPAALPAARTLPSLE